MPCSDNFAWDKIRNQIEYHREIQSLFDERDNTIEQLKQTIQELQDEKDADMPCYDPRGDIHEKWSKEKIEKHKPYLDYIIEYLKTEPELMVEYFNYLKDEEKIDVTEMTSSVGSIVGSICAFSKCLKTKEQMSGFAEYLKVYRNSGNITPMMWEQWLREHAEVDIVKSLYEKATHEEKQFLDKVVPKHIRDEIKPF